MRIYFSLAVLGLCNSGVGSQTRSISTPVCFFRNLCMVFLLSCIRCQLERNRCILLLRLVCDIPSSATTCMQYPFFKYYIRSYYMDFRLILGCLRLLMRYVFSLSIQLIVLTCIYIYIYMRRFREYTSNRHNTSVALDPHKMLK